MTIQEGYEDMKHTKKMMKSKLKLGYCKHGINHILPHDCDGCCSNKIKVINTNNKIMKKPQIESTAWRLDLNLPIPKNHNQRMYKFGYDTAKREIDKEISALIYWWEDNMKLQLEKQKKEIQKEVMKINLWHDDGKQICINKSDLNKLFEREK